MSGQTEIQWGEGIIEELATNDEWQECTLGEICTDISYGYTESASKEPIGPKFLRITDIANGRLNWDAVPYCPITDKNRSKYLLKPGDIVIARTGATTGATYTIKESDPKDVVFASYLIRYKIDHAVANPYYIGHLLSSAPWADFVEGIKGGSAQPGANAQQFASYEINLPPLPEQHAIAGVLSSLDDKIDLLHRQNATLEALAETLFRQWFVEEAKEEWEDGTLASVATNVRKQIKAENLGTISKYIGLEHIKRRSIALINHGYGADVTSNKSAFQENDILFGKLRPYFHKVCFAPFAGVCSTDILVIRPKRKELFAYCLFAFFQNDVVDYANLGSGGTRMPRTDWQTLSQYSIKIPPSQQLAEFNAIVMPAISKITSNVRLIGTLSNLRDTLLPKLMSGEVRVAY